MITDRFPRALRVWPVVTASILVFGLSHCEQNPLIVALPGSEWVFETEVIDTLDVQQLIRTSAHGNSLTLYAGQESDTRESGILIKFPAVDTTLIPDYESVELVLIRRTFADEFPEPGASFAVYTIEEDSLIWSESDTGATIADFTNIIDPYSLGMLEVSTLIVDANGAARDSVVEHLSIPLDTLLLHEWAHGTRANNGFLLKREDAGGLIGFHSRRNTQLSPYIAFSYHDTTTDGRDTVRSRYYFPTADLSVYPASPTIPIPPAGSLAEYILLDHSTGRSGYLNFGPYHEIDTTSMVAGARLILQVNLEASSLDAGQIGFRVFRRLEPREEGDSSAVLIEQVLYSPQADSIILNLGSFVAALAAGSIENFGLDLQVLPRNHDFDYLAIRTPNAAGNKRTRLEIVYSKPFQDLP
ncbi:MAG: hypothetical protein JSU61_09485 [Fidelibacterota bacterium]|nr:MAG: hypothetical protein JSU61_09485 [Candidatus Neomarinimicrobiota bacterium]